jgi:tRNA (guanine-N7-)-methyltransferase
VNESDDIQSAAGEARERYEKRIKALREALARTCAQMFPDPVAITLEIGCGHGHFLAAYAGAHPGEDCVGFDIISKRIRKGLAKRERGALSNLVFFKAEALEFLDALPAHVTLAKTFILFPDPWPKTRHHKHRLVQQPLLDKLASRTPPGGTLMLRTDHGGYFAWMGAEVSRNARWRRDDAAAWPFEAPSFFQSLMESWQSMVCVRNGL